MTMPQHDFSDMTGEEEKHALRMIDEREVGEDAVPEVLAVLLETARLRGKATRSSVRRCEYIEATAMPAEDVDRKVEEKGERSRGARDLASPGW